MRRFLPLAALLGVAFVLGCQDQGSGVVGPDGLSPQFAKGDNNGKPKGPGGEVLTYQFKVVEHDHDTYCDLPEESAWNSPSPTLGVEIKLTDYMSTGAGWRGVVPKSAKLTVSPYDADTGNLLPALLGGSVRLTVDLGMITSVKLGSCIPEPNLDCGRIKPNYATGSLSGQVPSCV